FSSHGRLSLSRVHERLQREVKGYYHPEVSLSFTTLSGGMYFTVSGIADGLIREGESLTADTVCFCRGYGFRIPPDELLVTKMKLYAYALARKEDRNEILARIAYVHTETMETKYFEYHFQTETLRQFVAGLLVRIESRAKRMMLREIEDLPAAARAPFPYPELREGQEIMIREVYGAIRRGKRLFVEAPTGTGKTMSALYPAVRALGERRIDKIFYLTAKTATGREAYRAAAKLKEAGVPLRTVVIAAKEQICQSPARHMGCAGVNPCNPHDCERAKGYYDRVSDAVEELLSSGYGYPTAKILEVAKKHGVCAYELSLDLSEHCDMIICDYNYAFDPLVYFRRYFSKEAGDVAPPRSVFLIDEAHNLADRARDMYSASIRRSELDRVVALCVEEEKISLAIAPVVMHMSRLRLLCKEDLIKDENGNDRGFYLGREPLLELEREMDTLRKKCEEWLRENRTHILAGEVYGLVSELKRYLVISEYFDRGFRCCVEFLDGDITVKTYCLDPSSTMNALLKRAHASILFSATLTPPEYFCDVLGGGTNAQSVSLPSPFEPEGLCVAVAEYLSLRMEDRKKSYARYATAIAATVSAKAGNYIAYFPSYECLSGVLNAFRRKYPNVETVVQKQGMGRAEREEFLGAFRDDMGHLRVGFCVLGGGFSEGVDLPGSRLIGSIIFGVGLPAITNERNIIEEHFNEITETGYDYAYTYPGMNRVLQAVGRVIRRDSDRGVAILVDDRYATPKYRHLFPAHWKTVQYARNAPSLAEIVRRFWEKQK
ncbi:MAG: ATP-dependent DNA helicase, partial [Clostridia bacterium]|nr:ATP-dependent DNA helicase [Clostridia bacterium]